MNAYGVLRSEWVKFRSVRAMLGCLAGAVVTAGSYGYLFGTAAAREYFNASAADRAAFDPTETAFRALVLVGVLVSAVGVLAVTSEYAAGTMPVSITAVPGRGLLLLGKGAVVALTTLLAGPPLALLSFTLSQAALAARGVPSAGLDDPGVPGALLGAGLFTGLIGLYGMALGFLLRRSAGAVSLGTFLLILPGTASLFPKPVAEWIVTWWPSAAGARIFVVHPGTELLAPLAGAGVLAATVLVLLCAAVAVFRRRDA
ncbi:hypothetical protein SAMN05421833_10752 [Microbispora rosea]|uniref:ABC-2 family transporter protein n=1 Tax=Microbispora rosea TaxID=58117 RepID=A0A1N6Z9S7_9ACTN|nr:hypothetical protein [Microbispora rosea]GIH47577.1 ABC transporter permease [Microbispora rosea subsp. rosea]SIR23538.1 hypothetical protein SAMN05421833_10752 [Microbispora rosea]